MRRPTAAAASCARAKSSGRIGTIGQTSGAPIRGGAPSWRRRSMRSRATRTPATSASASSSPEPTSVNTERLWSASACTSSTRACAARASAIAAIVAESRPSLKFGTDSSGSTRLLYEPVKEYYDRRAPGYDDWYLGRGAYAARDAAAWQADLDGLIGAIEALPPIRTLDVACGTGFLTRHLHGDVVGLDQSAAMLERAQLAAPHATFVRGDGLALPFPNDAFGRVFTGHFYGHLDKEARARFLGEVRRVAGELVVVDAALRVDHDAEEIQQRQLPDGSVWPVLKRFFTPDSLLAELGRGETLYSGPWFVVTRTSL